eukprot:gene17101-23398_t
MWEGVDEVGGSRETNDEGAEPEVRRPVAATRLRDQLRCASPTSLHARSYCSQKFQQAVVKIAELANWVKRCRSVDSAKDKVSSGSSTASEPALGIHGTLAAVSQAEGAMQVRDTVGSALMLFNEARGAKVGRYCVSTVLMRGATSPISGASRIPPLPGPRQAKIMDFLPLDTDVVENRLRDKVKMVLVTTGYATLTMRFAESTNVPTPSPVLLDPPNDSGRVSHSSAQPPSRIRSSKVSLSSHTTAHSARASMVSFRARSGSGAKSDEAAATAKEAVSIAVKSRGPARAGSHQAPCLGRPVRRLLQLMSENTKNTNGPSHALPSICPQKRDLDRLSGNELAKAALRSIKLAERELSGRSGFLATPPSTRADNHVSRRGSLEQEVQREWSMVEAAKIRLALMENSLKDAGSTDMVKTQLCSRGGDLAAQVNSPWICEKDGSGDKARPQHHVVGGDLAAQVNSPLICEKDGSGDKARPQLDVGGEDPSSQAKSLTDGKASTTTLSDVGGEDPSSQAKSLTDGKASTTTLSDVGGEDPSSQAKSFTDGKASTTTLSDVDCAEDEVVAIAGSTSSAGGSVRDLAGSMAAAEEGVKALAVSVTDAEEKMVALAGSDAVVEEGMIVILEETAGGLVRELSNGAPSRGLVKQLSNGAPSGGLVKQLSNGAPYRGLVRELSNGAPSGGLVRELYNGAPSVIKELSNDASSDIRKISNDAPHEGGESRCSLLSILGSIHRKQAPDLDDEEELPGVHVDEEGERQAPDLGGEESPGMRGDEEGSIWPWMGNFRGGDKQISFAPKPPPHHPAGPVPPDYEGALDPARGAGPPGKVEPGGAQDRRIDQVRGFQDSLRQSVLRAGYRASFPTASFTRNRSFFLASLSEVEPQHVPATSSATFLAATPASSTASFPAASSATFQASSSATSSAALSDTSSAALPATSSATSCTSIPADYPTAASTMSWEAPQFQGGSSYKPGGQPLATGTVAVPQTRDSLASVQYTSSSELPGQGGKEGSQVSIHWVSNTVLGPRGGRGRPSRLSLTSIPLSGPGGAEGGQQPGSNSSSTSSLPGSQSVEDEGQLAPDHCASSTSLPHYADSVIPRPGLPPSCTASSAAGHEQGASSESGHEQGASSAAGHDQGASSESGPEQGGPPSTSGSSSLLGTGDDQVRRLGSRSASPRPGGVQLSEVCSSSALSSGGAIDRDHRSSRTQPEASTAHSSDSQGSLGQLGSQSGSQHEGSPAVAGANMSTATSASESELSRGTFASLRIASARVCPSALPGPAASGRSSPRNSTSALAGPDAPGRSSARNSTSALAGPAAPGVDVSAPAGTTEAEVSTSAPWLTRLSLLTPDNYSGSYGRIRDFRGRLNLEKTLLMKQNPVAYLEESAAQAESDYRSRTEQAHLTYAKVVGATTATPMKFMRSVKYLQSERPFFLAPLSEKKRTVERFPVKAQEPDRRPLWSLETSLFVRRKKECEARAVFDTAKIRAAQFKLDWSRIVEKTRFQKLVGREDKGVKGKNASLAEELDEIRQELEQYKDELRAIFIYYAMVYGPMTSDSFMTLGFNTWLTFCAETGFVTNDSTSFVTNDLSTIFVAVNFEETPDSAEGAANEDDAMMRFEFYEGIIRAAFGRFIRTQVLPFVLFSLAAV